MEGAFDEYLSLGGRCETSFQIRRALSRDESCFFGWGAFDTLAIRLLLRLRFADVFRPKNIGWDPIDGVARETLYDFTFHSAWDTHNGPPPHEDPDFAAHLDDVRARGRHLAHKFLTPAGRRAYFYRTTRRVWSYEVDGLAELLAEISPDAVLIVLRRFEDAPINATHPMVRERVLRFFAPDFDCDRGADHVSWSAVFAEFPHRELPHERAAGE